MPTRRSHLADMALRGPSIASELGPLEAPHPCDDVAAQLAFQMNFDLSLDATYFPCPFDLEKIINVSNIIFNFLAT